MKRESRVIHMLVAAVYISSTLVVGAREETLGSPFAPLLCTSLRSFVRSFVRIGRTLLHPDDFEVRRAPIEEVPLTDGHEIPRMLM